MTIETVREICRQLPAVTEDVKWGNDLCFCVSGRMFAIVDLNPPHSIAFKCTPESFGELVERPGIRPAPYMARNFWVQEEQLGDVLDRQELEPLVRASYELVVARLPKSQHPSAESAGPRGRKHAERRRATASARKPAAGKPTKRRTTRKPNRRGARRRR
jgi:predicted DNA-binding protein (MmcQ/YjbR family)